MDPKIEIVSVFNLQMKREPKRNPPINVVIIYDTKELHVTDELLITGNLWFLIGAQRRFQDEHDIEMQDTFVIHIQGHVFNEEEMKEESKEFVGTLKLFPNEDTNEECSKDFFHQFGSSASRSLQRLFEGLNVYQMMHEFECPANDRK